MTPQLFSIVSGIRAIFTKHHPVIFISIVGLMLAGAVFSLYQVLDVASTPVVTTSNVTSFNQATVDKIKKLHDRNDKSESLVFPTPRTNPFRE